ncbi:uncharacterized protein PG986_010979 [Apiospora aurea]|uniref:Mid2 domain-containing protein n=1 Tax=Apiospora aurea TaxID=335848 RepID=A0ABR1Q532_9PEZI
MYSTRLIRMLMVALSIFTVVQATWFDLNILNRSPGLLDDLAKADNSTAPADESKPAASASAAPSPEPTTTKAADPTTTTKAADPTTTEQTKDPDPTPTQGNDNTNTTPTNAAPTTPNGGGQTTPTPGPVQTPSGGNSGGSGNSGPATPTTRVTSVKTTSDGKTFEVPQTLTETPKPTTTAKPYTSIFTYTTTLSDGRTSAVETQSVVTPTLSEGQTNSGDNGMAPQTRNTIIGVCVGVGGAIVLAAAGVLVWRLRARRRDQDDGEDLVNYGAGTSQFNNAGPEKNEPGSMSGRSPFQSTLESYHAPSSNTGTNF